MGGCLWKASAINQSFLLLTVSPITRLPLRFRLPQQTQMLSTSDTLIFTSVLCPETQTLNSKKIHLVQIAELGFVAVKVHLATSFIVILLRSRRF